MTYAVRPICDFPILFSLDFIDVFIIILSFRAIDMAKIFPHAEVIGVDIAPVPIDPESVPSNCQFEVDDIEFGVPHHHNQFDLVHARFLGAGLKDFHKSMIAIQKCLKPGGLLIWLEPDYDMLTPDIYVYRPIASEGHPTGSWTAHIVYGGFNFYKWKTENDRILCS